MQKHGITYQFIDSINFTLKNIYAPYINRIFDGICEL